MTLLVVLSPRGHRHHVELRENIITVAEAVTFLRKNSYQPLYLLRVRSK